MVIIYNMVIKHCSRRFLLLFWLFLGLCAVTDLHAANTSLSLHWDRNSESDIAGYRVHYGPIDAPYTHVSDVRSNSTSITDLASGTTYIFAVSAYNAAGVESSYSAPITVFANAVPGSGQQATLDNISSRTFVQTGDNVMIGGFIVQGRTPKTVVLRAIGPSLDAAGVAGAMSNPVLDVRDATGALLVSNDSWASVDGAALTALGLAPTDSREPAVILTLPAGAYSAIVHGQGSGRGVALFELYNLDRTQGSVANISTRGKVETGDQIMIGGFIIGGSKPTKVIVRAIGPSLLSQGVPDALLDPTLDLYDSEGTLVAANDNWRSTQQNAIIATSLTPTDNREAAIVQTLAPGAYSAVVRGQNDTTGVALFEVYALGQ